MPQAKWEDFEKELYARISYMVDNEGNVNESVLKTFTDDLRTQIEAARQEGLNAAMEKVTRFEVINKGREMVKYDISLELSLQDEGRTLKVFLTPNE